MVEVAPCTWLTLEVSRGDELAIYTEALCADGARARTPSSTAVAMAGIHISRGGDQDRIRKSFFVRARRGRPVPA